MNEPNEKLAVDDDPETAAFRAKCIEAIKRCNDPDLLESMIVLKRMTEAKAAEIAQLKAELELTKKQRDQATSKMEVRHDTIWMYDDREWVIAGSKSKTPDLYAHLDGRGK